MVKERNNMDINEARTLIKEISNKLRVNSFNYYVKSQPTIPDSEYDAMFNYLKKLEEEFPSLRLPDSPTQKIGSDLDVTSGFARIKHIKPVLSLANAFSEEDLMSWVNRNNNRFTPSNNQNVYAESIDYILEPKLDGLTLVVTYEKGILTTAVTRGTGEEGDDVTANAKTIRNLPLRICVNSDGEVDNAPDLLVVRGEVLFTEADFKRFNAQIVAKGEEPYVNARNAASGSLKQKYPTITASRPLSFFAYDIMHISGNYMPNTHSTALDYLNRVGLKAVGFSRVEAGINAVIKALESWSNYRGSFGFETDGVVIKINGIHLNDSLGFSGKDPRGSIAYKFQAEETSTTLKDVVWTVGRSGRLTPNAVLNPVSLGGTTISAASLHNMDTIRKIGIKVGDLVLIKRAGEVIPYVIGVVEDSRNGLEEEINPPTVCPACGTSVVKYDGEVDYNCPNRNCSERIYRNIENMVGKEYYDVDGVGSGVIRTLFEKGLIKDEADIFNIAQHRDAMLKLDKFGEKKVDGIIKSVANAKAKGEAWQLIASINISNVGRSLGKILMKHYGTIDKLMKVPVAELAEIEGIGSTTSNRMYGWFQDPINLALMEKFRQAGLNFGKEVVVDPSSISALKLNGKTYVLTGSMITSAGVEASRNDVQKMIEEEGGKCSGSVSKKTDFVVVGPGAGDKAAKAKELDRPIISYDDLLEMIK